MILIPAASGCHFKKHFLFQADVLTTYPVCLVRATPWLVTPAMYRQNSDLILLRQELGLVLG